jgi:hypothetical protein
VSTAPPIEPAPPGAASNRGCWKAALLGCGACAILLVVALVGIGIYVQKRPSAVTDLLMDRIRASYAAEVTAEDKAELDSAYAHFRQELEAKKISKEDIERVRDAVKIGREVGRSEVHELTQVYREAVAHVRGAPATTEPAPIPAATPVP